MAWHQFKTIWYLSGDLPCLKSNRVRIAAFDFDGTLSKFVPNPAKNNNPQLLTPNVPEVLNDYFNNGWIVIIFSNQKYAESLQPLIRQKFDKFVKFLSFNPWIFLATMDDNFRKPNPDMYNLFLEKVTEKCPDLADKEISPVSFYAGDAAGPDNPKKEYRWSDSDKVFACNICLAFFTPDKVF